MTFRSQIDEELQVYWMTRDGEEHDVGILEPLGEVMHQSLEGHAFRVRRMLGEKEVVAETLLGRSNATARRHRGVRRRARRAV